MSAAPIDIGALLLTLGRAGIELAPHPADPTWLRHRPADLAPDVTQALRTHKAAILAALAGGYAPRCPEAAYLLGERLGAADGLERPTHPGSPAWSIAVGEAMAEDARERRRRMARIPDDAPGGLIDDVLRIFDDFDLRLVRVESNNKPESVAPGCAASHPVA